MYDYLVTEKEIKSQNKSGEVCTRKWWKTKKASSFDEFCTVFWEKCQRVGWFLSNVCLTNTLKKYLKGICTSFYKNVSCKT